MNKNIAGLLIITTLALTIERNNAMHHYTDEITWFKAQLSNSMLSTKLTTIRLIIADVDGALTDNMLYQQENGAEIKGYSVQDGFGITHALKAGLQVAIVTGKSSPIIQERARKLGIPEELCRLGMDKDKKAAVQEIQKILGITKEETVIFGDDVLDIGARSEAAVFACPLNALFYVRSGADLVVPRTGGDGAFRMLLDLILFLQNKHFATEIIKQALESHEKTL